MVSTRGTDPLAHAEILDSGVLEATISARLRGGVEPVHRKENASAPLRLVLKLMTEFAPRGVRNVTRDLVIPQHSSHVEVFEEDDPVLFCDKVR